MGRFAVVREFSSRSLEKVDRFRVEGEIVVIYLDGSDRFRSGEPK